MKLSFSVPTNALVAVNTHADIVALERLSVDGPRLTFDFSGLETVEEALASITGMDEFLGLAIAESDNPTEIAQLSDLKRAVAYARSDVVREYAYKTRARVTEGELAEATAADAESQLHANSHTDISDSSSSNGASLEEKEVSDYGTSQQKADGKPVARKRRGR